MGFSPILHFLGTGAPTAAGKVLLRPPLVSEAGTLLDGGWARRNALFSYYA